MPSCESPAPGPGGVGAAGQSWRGGATDGHFEIAARRAAAVPLGRQGTALAVANAALFLASNEAACITGVIPALDGGQSARIG